MLFCHCTIFVQPSEWDHAATQTHEPSLKAQHCTVSVLRTHHCCREQKHVEKILARSTPPQTHTQKGYSVTV